MRAILTALVLGCCFHTVEAQTAPPYTQWKGLENGPYRVGFKLIEIFDSTRVLLTDSGQDSLQKKKSYFPIQMGVWYPSDQQWDVNKAMRFNRFFEMALRKNDFHELTPEEQDDALTIFYNFAKYGLSVELSDKELEAIGNTPTAAMENVEPAAGPFPVLLAGHDGGIWKSTILKEYLASHGYVILSTGFLSDTYSILSGQPEKALNRRLMTFEYQRKRSTRLDFADTSRMGLIGMNADGMSALLYQMKTQRASALLSLDGWEGKNNGHSYVTSHPNYDTSGFQTAYMEFQQDEESGRESLQLNSAILENLRQSDRYSYVMNGFGHAHLTGNMMALPELDEQVAKQYRFLFRSALAFFDAYVIGDQDVRQKLRQSDRSSELGEGTFVRSIRLISGRSSGARND